jgi:hypothetical protein
MAAVCDAGGIQRLLDILGRISMEKEEVVCASALILSRMVEYKRPLAIMAKENIILSLCCVAAYPLSDEAVVALAQALSKCFLEYTDSHSWTKDTTSPNPMPSLIRLLSRAHLKAGSCGVCRDIWRHPISALMHSCGIDISTFKVSCGARLFTFHLSPNLIGLRL